MENQKKNQSSGQKIKVVKSEELSEPYFPRFVIIDEETGEIVDDAQGYGYKTIKGAYAAFTYKNKSKSDKWKKQANALLKYAKEHESEINSLDEDLERIWFYGAKEGIPKKELDMDEDKRVRELDFPFEENKITPKMFLKILEKLRKEKRLPRR